MKVICILFLGLASALPNQSGMAKIFVRTSQRSMIPEVNIVFPDGHEDSLVLNYYYSTEEARMEGKANCNLFGHLKNEPEACVGVSGCYGSEDMHFTINSLHNSEGNGYILKTNGELVMVEDELASGKAHAHAVNLDGDYMEIPSNLKMASAKTATSRATSVPPGTMTVKFGYDDTFYAQFGNNAASANAYIESMMVHMQAFYCLSSLGTKIALQRVDAITYHAGNTWKADSATLNSNGPLNTLTENSASSADIFVYLCKDTEYYGTIGLGWVGTICIWKPYSCSINEWRNTVIGTARVVVHEMGHNLGMSHDFDAKHSGKGCDGTGFMSYGSPPDKWSTCSKSDLLEHYNKVLGYAAHDSSVSWCISNDASVCGSAPAPSPPAPAPSPPAPAPSPPAPAPSPPAPTSCENFNKSWWGDGYCDDILNNAACGYDGGDCCFSKLSDYEFYCSECACKQSCSGLISSWWGDSYCDDFMNTAACSFDGGDCCKRVGTDWNASCTECKCLDPFTPI